MKFKMNITRFDSGDIMTASSFVTIGKNMDQIFSGGSVKSWVQSEHGITINGTWNKGDGTAHLHYDGNNTWTVTPCYGDDHDGYDFTTFGTDLHDGTGVMNAMKSHASKQ